MSDAIAAKRRRAITKGRLKYVADLLRSLGVLVIGVGLVTPALTGKPVSGVTALWEALALLLIVLGLS